MLKINILGTSFAIESDEPIDYLQTILDMVKERIITIEESFPTTDSLKKAILACFLLAEEVHILKNRQEESHKLNEEESSFVDRMIHRIDETIYPSETSEK